MMDKKKEGKDMDDLSPMKHASGATYAKHKKHLERMYDPMSMYTETKGKELYDTAMREYPTKRSAQAAKKK